MYAPLRLGCSIPPSHSIQQLRRARRSHVLVTHRLRRTPVSAESARIITPIRCLTVGRCAAHHNRDPLGNERHKHNGAVRTLLSRSCHGLKELSGPMTPLGYSQCEDCYSRPCTAAQISQRYCKEIAGFDFNFLWNPNQPAPLSTPGACFYDSATSSSRATSLLIASRTSRVARSSVARNKPALIPCAIRDAMDSIARVCAAEGWPKVRPLEPCPRP